GFATRTCCAAEGVGIARQEANRKLGRSLAFTRGVICVVVLFMDYLGWLRPVDGEVGLWIPRICSSVTAPGDVTGPGVIAGPPGEVGPGAVGLPVAGCPGSGACSPGDWI